MDDNKVSREEAEAAELLQELLPIIVFWAIGIIAVSCFMSLLPLT